MLDLREFEKASEAAMYAVGDLARHGDRIWNTAIRTEIKAKSAGHDSDLDDLAKALAALDHAVAEIVEARRHLHKIEIRGAKECQSQTGH